MCERDWFVRRYGSSLERGGFVFQKNISPHARAWKEDNFFRAVVVRLRYLNCH